MLTARAPASRVVACVIGWAATALGCERPPAPLDPYRARADVAYGPEPWQKLDIYLGHRSDRAESFESPPTMLYVHGGGWLRGDKESDSGLMTPFLRLGWNVVSVDYRVGPGTAPQAVEDVSQAVSWVHRNAAELGLGMGDLVIAGASAGGMLALTSGLRAREPIAAVINWWGVTDIAAVEAHLRRVGAAQNFVLGWVGDAAEVAVISAAHSPVELVHGTAPPIVSVHSRDDEIVPYSQARSLHDLLDQTRVENRLIPLSGIMHGAPGPDALSRVAGLVHDFAVARIGR